MADTVTSHVLINQAPFYSIRLTNSSDGTGESAVVKVDKSTLTGIDGLEPIALDLIEAEWTCAGMSVLLLWDHSTDDTILLMSEHGEFCGKDAGPLRDPRSAGGTGDILLTTVGHTSGDTYNIVLHFKMREA
jgi:hypothetical protein